MNTSPKLCPECGQPLPADSPHQLCPACLLAQALASQTAVAGEGPAVTAPPPTPEEMAGRFPQFEILECLGRGGMGVVYKARQKSLNRLVAIKIVAPERERDAHFAERFAREAELLAKLSHPHIVTIHDFGETGGLYYLVMEYVDGVNLRDLLRDGKLEPKQALAIVPEICEALQFAHEHGIVHRDIKPANILLDRHGRVKVADFGLAKLIGAGEAAPGAAGRETRAASDLTEAGRVMGTPSYMAPEQAEHPAEVDHRADIYALGVVLYQMLTGELPGKQLEAPSKKVQIDVRLDEIVLRALEKTPALRYQTAGELRTQVESITGGAVGTPAPRPASNRKPEGRAAHVLFAVLYLGLVIGLLVSASRLPDRVADHFGVEGQANGWMGRPAYLTLIGALPVFFALLFAGLGRLIRSFPQLINIPRRHYWLAPERRDATVAVIRGRLVWLLCLETIFFGGLHALVVAANQTHPPRLPMGGLLALIIVFFLGLMIWIVTFLTRLAETDIDRPLPARPAPSVAAAAEPKILLSAAAFIFGCLSGIIPTIFYWLAPWLVPWLSPAGQEVMLGLTLVTAILAIVLGSAARASWWGRCALLVGGLNLGIWVVMLFASLLSPHTNRPASVQGADQSRFGPVVERVVTSMPWSPAVAPGSKPDLQQILSEAHDLASRGLYEEALQRHLWFHHHALEFGPAFTGVRLSFALSYWADLGRRYPKAKQALIEVRNHDVQELSAGRGDFPLFMEVDAINRYLQAGDASFDLFKTLASVDQELARRCYPLLEERLVARSEYEVCLGYIGDPQARFESLRQNYETTRELPGERPKSQQDQLRDLAKETFVTSACRLIEILIATGRKPEAEKIGDQAVAILDDSRLKSAVTDAERKISSKPSSSPIPSPGAKPGPDGR